MAEEAMAPQNLRMIMLLLRITLTKLVVAPPSPMDQPTVVAPVEDMRAILLLHMMVDIKYPVLVSYQWYHAGKKKAPLPQSRIYSQVVEASAKQPLGSWWVNIHFYLKLILICKSLCVGFKSLYR